MNTNPEGFPSEDDRVASFMQALQRMHDDPAEAARIELMIEEADAELDAYESGDGQSLVVHIHNEGHLDFTAPRQVVEPPPVPAKAEARSEGHSKPTKKSSPGFSVSGAAPLPLMAVVVVFSMQEGRTAQWLTAALAVVFMLTAGSLTLIRAMRERETQSSPRRVIRRGRARARARELNRH